MMRVIRTVKASHAEISRHRKPVEEGCTYMSWDAESRCRDFMSATLPRRWRQVLGSTMHCVAGDGVGILVGAAISSILGLHGPSEVLLEYLLGFAFGWTIFQALFMRDMVGGSYPRSLSSTFIPELLSMNLLMAGMVPVMIILRSVLAPTAGPEAPAFWFVMSIALLAGFIFAYPMNWWLVANNLKHGMMTIRRADTMAPAGAHVDAGHPATGVAGGTASGMDHGHPAPVPPVSVMTLVSLLALAAGTMIGLI
jgi:Domain of unknown function (DUF4396)